MILSVTPETIKVLRREGFYPDEMLSIYFVMKGLFLNEIESLDNFDDFNSSKRAVILYQKLFKLGFIEKDKEGSQVFFKLTEKGGVLLDELEPKKEPSEEEVKKEAVKKPKIVLDWIEEWVSLFPERNHNGILRSEPEDCLPRMVAFIKKYKYTKEVIIAATKAYITKESYKNYEYTKRAMFFIDKRSEGSLLAAWCKSVAESKLPDGSLNDGSRTEIIQTVN